MLKTDLIAKNPMGAFNRDAEGNDVARMGLVMARPGSGKTAILVQIALDAILRGKQVVHVSIGQSLEKTKAWYDDILTDVSASAKHEDVAALQLDVSHNRIIMTFNASTFSRPKLEERLNDLIFQDILRPCCMIIDGLDFEKVDRKTLEDMRDLQKAANMSIWFSAVTHRDAQSEAIVTHEVPAPCNTVGDLFDTVIMLQPESSDNDRKIFLNVLADRTGCVASGKSLRLDPTSFLVWGATI
jgi:hypothetical protein